MAAILRPGKTLKDIALAGSWSNILDFARGNKSIPNYLDLLDPPGTVGNNDVFVSYMTMP